MEKRGVAAGGRPPRYIRRHSVPETGHEAGRRPTSAKLTGGKAVGGGFPSRQGGARPPCACRAGPGGARPRFAGGLVPVSGFFCLCPPAHKPQSAYRRLWMQTPYRAPPAALFAPAPPPRGFVAWVCWGRLPGPPAGASGGGGRAGCVCVRGAFLLSGLSVPARAPCAPFAGPAPSRFPPTSAFSAGPPPAQKESRAGALAGAPCAVPPSRASNRVTVREFRAKVAYSPAERWRFAREPARPPPVSSRRKNFVTDTCAARKRGDALGCPGNFSLDFRRLVMVY